jgi:hypothetical protein
VQREDHCQGLDQQPAHLPLRCLNRTPERFGSECDGGGGAIKPCVLRLDTFCSSNHWTCGQESFFHNE